MKKLLAVAIGTLLVGCASTAPEGNSVKAENKPVVEARACFFPDTPEQKAPTWVCDQKVDGLTVQAMGMSENGAAGLSHQRQLAMMDAHVVLASQVKNHIDSSIQKYSGTKGVKDKAKIASTSELTQSLVVSQDLKGAEVYQSVISKSGVYYVLVGLNKGDMEQFVKKVVVESVEQNDGLWQSVTSVETEKQPLDKAQLAADIANFAVSQ